MWYIKILLTTLLIMFSVTDLKAQLYELYDMTLSEQDGTWEPLTGGTYLTAGDDQYAYFSLPFTFKLDGVNHTWGYANTNGFIGLSRVASGITLTPGSSSNGYNTVSWANGDLYTYNGIYYNIEGSSPNRVAIFQWNYVRIPYYTGDHYIDAQIRLYETSNKIEMIYGPSTGTPPMSYILGVFISGRSVSSYGPVWSVNPFQEHKGTYPSLRYIRGPNFNETGYNSRLANAQNWNQHFPRGHRIVYGKSNPEIKGIYPTGGEIYRKGEQIGGGGDAERHPAMFVKRTAGMPAVFANFKISGPVGSSNPIDIYTAKDASFDVNMGNIIGDSARFNFTVGIGPCFGTNGVLDLQSWGGLEPGEYSATAAMKIDQIGTLSWNTVKFNVALPWDLAIKKILIPKEKKNQKYPLESNIPVTISVSNFGLNDVTRFTVYTEIYDKSNTKIYDKSVVWTAQGEEKLESAEAIDIFMGNFYPPSVGDYKVVSWVMLSDATDQLPTNNFYPRSGEPDYIFSVSKEVDLKAVAILKPSSSNEIIIGRPIIPRARFTNQGINDVDNDYIAFQIKYQDGQIVYRDTVYNYVISAGTRFDTTDVNAKKNFIPPYVGNYNICAVIYSPWDENPLSVRTICDDFQVKSGLLGNYTIGTGTGNRHFTSIQAAVDALYEYGVAGNVNFELKDKSYEIGDLNDDKNPALDLSSHITGLGPNAQVTFKPSNDRSVERAGNNSGVTIQVKTGSGYGILMGQNETPQNPYAIVLGVPSYQRNQFSKPTGYINWDGGQNKSIRFVLKTPTDKDIHFHSIFYLRQGTQYSQIKNCIFENDYKNSSGNNRIPHVYLPKVRLNGTAVQFMKDKEYTTTGFSAAIIMRAVAPTDKGGTNTNFLDTVPINNNVISGNEISGFGYGIVDLGAGVLLRQLHAKWERYYNYNNTISNNIIKDVARAGIYLGYTDGEIIKGNRIYNVTGVYLSQGVVGMESKGGQVQAGGSKASYDASGIMAGGENEPNWNGYNNLNLSIDGNEISSVKSDYVAYGIKVEQSRNSYGSGNNLKIVPDVKENTMVINNIVWGMTAKDNNASVGRFGIRLFTQRTDFSKYIEAQDPDYFTWDDKVISNTVIMPDDGGSTSGALAGIAVQHSKATKILNNAVAVLDNYFSQTSPLSALIFYQGILPEESHGLESNRNAFWKTDETSPTGAAVYGFVELNKEGEFIEPISPNLYDQNAYETLRQWRAWTGEDINSIFGDFTQDFTTITKSADYLRIKSPKPFGSVLNDRGFRLHEYLNDNSGNLIKDALNQGRGTNGQLFDIGAEEFEGQSYSSDVEFVMISSPVAYKSGSGDYADAEHIMTYLPLKLKLILRNSGNMLQSATKVRLTVTDEDVDRNMRYYDTVETDIIIAQSKEVIFDLPDGLIKTYTDLEDLGFNPVVPSRFAPYMKSNVTPRYKFSIEVQSDENNANNYGEAVMRFYTRRANTTLMLISAEHSNADIYNLNGPVRTQDEIAGRLNFEALKTGFNKIGYHTNDVLDSFKIDVFDRLAWEPKAIDYTMYKYIFWSDRNDVDATSNRNSIDRYQQKGIMEFLEEGTTDNKRNLVIASQEAVRNLDFETNHSDYDDKSTKFVNDYMRSTRNGNGYAFGSGIDAHGKKIKGVSIGRDIIHTITRTGLSFNYGGTVVTDANPFPGTCLLFKEGDGLAKESFMYPEASTDPLRQYSGVSFTTMKKITVYIGIDWRHFDDIEKVLRTILDYYDKNGGTSVPVELTNFDAKAISNRVEIIWETASEFNTARFEVEKALIINGSKSGFTNIATKDAAGTSANTIEYGPIVDKDVKLGNSYVYRLKMIDLDGKYDYSNEKLAEIGGNAFWLGEPIPNPAVNETVKFDIITGNRNIEVWLIDINGKRIDINPNFINNNQIEINLSMVQSGYYTIIVQSGELVMTRQFQVIK